ncbi:hypothetical protein NO559_06275 [Dasania sp. GY-MA-18]|uniref:Tetratricopeptide repeat protein n=1 Tax=Dasania phycosphaerae TaxID=2950436 RepID=A0A9J6RJC2_9GAMM|nr:MULTISPECIES: hypothetical protein [Dasania]MCR8922370.1 hypothetical protein [Dasania sp. GY-MA-18]MCZ0864798.1 hypothetical protein [Dasania phycosphaerae]MCZ0868526.1 hypothetical protein [Dasania phycosphaerae]
MNIISLAQRWATVQQWAKTARYCAAGILLSLPFSLQAETVKDLRYGVALYHFYQEDYFNALLELISAQHLQALPNHQSNAELLKGGISLSYGLDRQAEAIFSQLLSGQSQHRDAITLSEAQKNKAWFYLGKLIYQQGDYARAINALSYISPVKTSGLFTSEQPAPLQIQAHYLQATMLLALGEPKLARQSMLAVPEHSIYWPYYYFNLGSSYAAQQQWPAAIAAYEQTHTLMQNHKGEQALKDKANTAAGYAYMAKQDYVNAVKAFRRVSLNSLVVDKALLGYGLAESERENYPQALAPWQALRKQSLLLPSVQEVMLALPYAYEKLGGLSEALSEYQQAAQAYQQEIQQLDAAIGQFSGQPLEQLFSLTGLNKSWLSKRELPPISNNSIYLTHLIAKHSFQANLRDYYDLSVLKKHVLQLQKRHENLLAVDGEQQHYWQQLTEGGQLKNYQTHYQQLLALRNSLAEKIQQAETIDPARSVAQGDDFELWQIVDRAYQRIAQLSQQGQDVSVERELLSRYEDVLSWRTEERYADNRWQLSKQLTLLDQHLSATQSTIVHLQAAVGEKAVSPFRPRLQQLQQRLAQQQAQIDTQLGKTSDSIRQLAITELAQQKQQLQQYLARATLAIARLYDLGSQQQPAAQSGASNE